MTALAVPIPPTTPVIVPDIRASIDKAVADVANKGAITAGVSLTGLEVSYGHKLSKNLSVGGYAKKLWGAEGWQAAAQAKLQW